ncbi:MAG: membrane dipeptidase [Candidatus Lambdaproteobacteria bacterium]|nr:membrane dipeptidase [Candidatus Lambdaproteobacteria bacterium]
MALRPNKGFHPIVEQPFPYLFVDGCIQSWPDADYANAHKHLVSAYGVTAFRPYHTFEEASAALMEWHLVARSHPNLVVATLAEHIGAARAAQQAAMFLCAQGGTWVSNKLYRVETFYRLGLRVMLPAYNADNTICGGCLDSANLGLTRFGRLFVKEADRLGLLLDGSHVSERGSLDLTETSANPLVYSHSDCKALVDHPRNITDEQIKACIARGGVVCVAPFGPFLLRSGRTTRPTVADLCDHVDHIAQLVGNCRGIGVGTDMSLGTYDSRHSNPWGTPAYKDADSFYGLHISRDTRSPLRACDGFDTFSEAGNFAAELERRGYAAPDLRSIFGENLLRVFAQVWKPVPANG